MNSGYRTKHMIINISYRKSYNKTIINIQVFKNSNFIVIESIITDTLFYLFYNKIHSVFEFLDSRF